MRAHTGRDDEASRLNAKADALAKSAHRSGTLVLPFTGWMQPYAVWSEEHRWAPSSWKTLYRAAAVNRRYRELPATPQERLHHAINPVAPHVSPHFYTKSTARTTAKYEMILRTGGFITKTHLGETDTSCECGAPFDDVRHLFTECPLYDSHRRTAVRMAVAYYRKHRRKGQREGAGAGNRRGARDLSGGDGNGDDSAPDDPATAAACANYEKYLMDMLTGGSSLHWLARFLCVSSAP